MTELNVPQRTLYDIRDGETYRVRKLADGNVWMTENLRLTLEEGKAIEISDGSIWLPTNYDGTTTNSTTLTVSDYDDLPSIWAYTGNTIGTVDVVRSYNTAGSAEQYKCNPPDHKTRGTNLCYETVFTDDGDEQKVGAFYNWYTATASTGKYNTGLSVDAVASICPKNWSLPSYNSETKPSWYQMITGTYKIVNNSAISGPKAFKFPISVARFGYFLVDVAASVGHQNNRFQFWTSTGGRDEIENASIFSSSFSSGSSVSVTPTGDRKRAGFSIRCAISGL